MPDKNLPLWWQRTLRVLRVLSYLFLAISAFGALVSTPLLDERPHSLIVFHVWGTICLVSSILCAISNITYRWRIEYLFVWFTLGSFAVYASAAWTEVKEGDGVVTSASGISVVVVFLLIRAVELQAFARKAAKAVTIDA